MSGRQLHTQPDQLRDVVEKFLTMFVTDPLPAEKAVDRLATPGAKRHLGVPESSHSHASPFDLPSIARRPGMMRSVTDGHVYTGSPVSKRAVDGGNQVPT